MTKIINAWHRDYAVEVLKRHDAARDALGETSFAESACSTGNVLPLILKIAADTGNEKLASIAATVASTEADIQAQGNRCRRRVTAAQRGALGRALLAHYGTARAIATAAWGLTAEEIAAA